MYKIVLTGGGTAGHVIPNLALVSGLKKYFDEIYYIGSNDGIERELVKKYDLPYHYTETAKLDRTHPLKNIKIPFSLLSGVSKAREILQVISPDVIFSKGGYVSLPTCFAAWQEKIPLVVHESDITLGVANKIASKFATTVITSFEETEGGEFIGNPVRSDIFDGSKDRAIKNYKITGDKPIILIFGGSSGSTVINEAVYKALPTLTQKYNIVHIAGKNRDLSVTNPSYYQIEYASDINDLYAAASVVVSRAGSNTLCELAALGKKTIAVPLPKGNSRGDQIDNAISYQKRGFVVMLEQSKLTPESLIENINNLYFSSKPTLTLNVKDINERIIKRILDAARDKKEQ